MSLMSLTVGLLVFPRVQQLDLTGPYEVFASAPDLRVELVGRTRDEIISATALVLRPTTDFVTCPPLDVLCIPGGIGINPLLTDPVTLAFVKQQAAGARYVTSVCTGAFLLGAAGLLRGKRATTHWAAYDLLPLVGAIPTKGRVVQDGNLFTGGGVTAGIDFALTLVAEIFGQAVAETVQLGLEYAPAPPFAAGTPDTAPAAVLAQATARAEASRRERETILRSLAIG